MAAHDLIYTNSEDTALNLNNGAAYRLGEDGIVGAFSRPRENIVEPGVASRQSTVLVASNPLSRMLRIPLIVYGATRPLLWTALTALKNHFDIDAEAGKYGQLSYENESGVTRAWRVLPIIDDAEPAMQWWSPMRTMSGWVQTEIRVHCIDHLVYDPTPIEVSDDLSGTTPVDIECVNPGTKNAYIAEIEVDGTATNFKVTDANGAWLQFADTVGAAEELSIVLLPWALSITHTSGSWMNKRATGSSIVQIPPGTNNLTVVGEDVGDDATVTVTFYPTYGGF